MERSLEWVFSSDNCPRETGLADGRGFPYEHGGVNEAYWTFNHGGRKHMMTMGSNIILGRPGTFVIVDIQEIPVFQEWHCPPRIFGS